MRRTGIKVEKRKTCDDLFIENFRKKLRIESSVEMDETAEIVPLEGMEPRPPCTALILYREPVQELPTELLDKLKRQVNMPFTGHFVLSKEHFCVENVLEMNREEAEKEIDKQSDNDMDLD